MSTINQDQMFILLGSKEAELFVARCKIQELEGKLVMAEGQIEQSKSIGQLVTDANDRLKKQVKELYQDIRSLRMVAADTTEGRIAVEASERFEAQGDADLPHAVS